MPATRSSGKSVLVFRLGALGDTLVAMPALRAIRRHFAGARITLLCDVRPGRAYVPASELVRGSGAADDFIHYPIPGSRLGRLLRPLRMIWLALRLRTRRYDTAVYLPPSGRTPEQVRRDRQFFRLAGIHEVIGADVSMELPSRKGPRPLPVLQRETDYLLARLSQSGIPTQSPSPEDTSIHLRAEDQAEVDRWVAALASDGGRAWVAVAPGSKMASKRWPVERYQEVVARLIERFNIWPVVFGGPEDREAGDRLIAAWGRGHNAAGKLGPRASVAAIARARLYLGNDTGTMHMAASEGVRCVAVFSSRNFAGLWDPYGAGHAIFRTSIDCEGCMLETCVDRRTECLTRIGADEVYAACARLLAEPASVAAKVRAP